MTEPSGVVTVLVAAIVALPATLLAWATLKNARAAVVKGTVVEDKANHIIGQNTEIKALADGNLSKLASELSTANARIEGLERLVSSMTPKTSV